MEEKNLLQIEFGSFIKLLSSIFLSLGIVAGILVFVINLFGGNITANLGSILQLTGISAGLVSLVIFPIMFYLMGVIWGLFAFFPFKFFLKIMKGIKLKGTLE